MLTGEKIVQFIFTEENLSNYVVKNPRENPHWNRIIKRTSWCDYQADGTTTVYLLEGDKGNVEAIYAAIHEACHALNFRNHQHYAWYKQRLVRVLVWSALMVLLYMGNLIWHWQLHHVGILLGLFMVFNAYRFLQAYRIDETQVEILTIQMVKRHLPRAMAWAGDSRTAQALLPGIRQETIQYHERIQVNANRLMLLYLTIVVVYSVNELGLGPFLLNHL